jgi:outer membrane protein assembly complex protein YaeT
VSRALPWILVAVALAGCAGAPEQQPAADLDVRFEGSSDFDFRLRRVIEDQLIDFTHDTAREAPLFDAALDLQDHLVTLGHPDAVVTYELRREPKLVVVFKINQGPQVTVRTVSITGQEAISYADLLALWPRTRSGQFGLGDPLYVKSDLTALRLSMLQLFDARGYLDAKVTGPVEEQHVSTHEVSVAYSIEAGPQYRIGKVQVAPDLHLDAGKLAVAALPGKPFDRVTAAALRQRANSLLLNTGYPEPRVELELAVDREAHTVDLALNGRAGPRAHVAAVTVSGNDHTADFVIHRHVRMAPGELYDGSQIEKTTSELYKTGLFSKVDVERHPHDGDPEKLDLNVKVHEADARELDFLAGYGSYEGLRGGVTWTDRNLFGYGQRLQLAGRVSEKGEGLSASWVEPQLFGSDTSLTVTSHVRERQEPSYMDVSHGIELALARDLVDELRGRIGYALQTRDGSDIDPSIVNAVEDRYLIGSVFTELSLDHRDSKLYPANGYRLAVKYEYAGNGVGGTIDLERLTWSASSFTRLFGDVVLGLYGHAGVIWSPQPELPVQERFYNGGESSVRSFHESMLGPLSPTGTPLGGVFFNTLSAELRLPLWKALQWAVFTDAGNVGVNPDQYNLKDLRYAIGAGIRLVLPIGPLRLDAAENPDRRPGEDLWVVHLSVGLPF